MRPRSAAAAACLLAGLARAAFAAPVDVRHVTTYGAGVVGASATSATTLAVAVANGVVLYDTEDGTALRALDLGRVALVDAVAVASDGTWVATQATDGLVDLWDVPCAQSYTYKGFPPAPSGDHALRLRFVEWRVSAGWENLTTGAVEWYELPTDGDSGDTAPRAAGAGPVSSPLEPRWAPDEMSQPRSVGAVVVGWIPEGRRKTLEVWSVPRRQRVVATQLRAARWYRPSDDARFAVVGTYDQAGVRVFDLNAGRPVAMSALPPADLAACGLPVPHRRVEELVAGGHVYASRPLNTQLVALVPPDWREAVKRWVVSAGMRSCDSMPPQVEAAYRDQWHDLPDLAFAYSRPDRMWALAISTSFGVTDGTRGIVLWDHDTHERLGVLDGHTVYRPKGSGALTPYVHAVAFSADGRYLVSGGADATVRVWDMRDRAEAAKLTGHVGPVRYVAFAADGRRFVSGSADGTVREWVIDQN